jgi:hypothetical protein
VCYFAPARVANSGAIGAPVAAGSATPSQRAIVGAMSIMSTVPSATCGTSGPNAISDAPPVVHAGDLITLP